MESCPVWSVHANNKCTQTYIQTHTQMINVKEKIVHWGEWYKWKMVGWAQCQPDEDITDGWLTSSEEAKRNFPTWLFCYPRDKVRMLSSGSYWGEKSEVSTVQRAVGFYVCAAITSLTMKVPSLHPARACSSPTSFEEPFSGSSPVRPHGVWPWSLISQFLHRASDPEGPSYRPAVALNLYLSLVILSNFSCVYMLSCQPEREAWRMRSVRRFHLCTPLPSPSPAPHTRQGRW